jgi:hypothetical protein
MVTQPNQYRAANWRKSSASVAYTDCVEVGCSSSFVLVRDSIRRSGVVLGFTTAQWRGFLRDIKNADAGQS